MDWIFRLYRKCTGQKNRQGTVRFMFPALISFAVILGAAVISSSESSYIRLQTSQTTIEEGGRFTVIVYANAHVPVNAVDVTLQFDNKAVEVLEVDRGQSVITIWAQDPVVENGKVVLRGGTYRKGFIGEHQIASIDLKAKQSGLSNVSATNIMLLAGDGQGSPVSVKNDQNTSVNLYIYDENSTPENIGVNVKINIVTDIDGDGKVTLRDVRAFMAAWSTRDQIFDFNGDGRMTFKDFSIILSDMFFK